MRFLINLSIYFACPISISITFMNFFVAVDCLQNLNYCLKKKLPTPNLYWYLNHQSYTRPKERCVNHHRHLRKVYFPTRTVTVIVVQTLDLKISIHFVHIRVKIALTDVRTVSPQLEAPRRFISEKRARRGDATLRLQPRLLVDIVV